MTFIEVNFDEVFGAAMKADNSLVKKKRNIY